jgi:CO/xanthine dehydrogenase FAD-binding subunit
MGGRLKGGEALYLRPNNVDEALSALASQPWSVLGGGTDFYPARAAQFVRDDVLDISNLAELRGIAEGDIAWRIGALTTWSDIIRAALPPVFKGLKLAARQVGAMQIQNAGTVAGNLCNASPAADGVPVLMALGAEVELSSADTARRVPLTEFVTGNRTTARRPNELVTAVLIPRWGTTAKSTFLKLGARKYLVISIASVAVALETDGQNIVTGVGIAVGACAPVARRLTGLERKLTGTERTKGMADLVAPEDLSVLAPISDIRGTAQYRREASLTLVQRALGELADA